MPKYINADALLKEAKRISGPFTGDGWDNFGVYALIERQPAADVSPVRKGQWIPEPDRYYHWHCSECGYVIGVIKMDADYCLKCGADMREEKDDGESTK